MPGAVVGQVGGRHRERVDRRRRSAGGEAEGGGQGERDEAHVLGARQSIRESPPGRGSWSTVPIMRRFLALAAVLAGCAGAQPQGTVAGTDPCAALLGKRVFRDPGTTHVLVASFALADALPLRVEAERARAEHVDLGGRVPVQALELSRLACPVESHARAREIARALDADLVIWGRASCSAGDPCASATLRSTPGETRISAPFHRFEDVSDLDLPAAPAPDAPLVADFVVGFHFSAQNDDDRAAWAFGEAAKGLVRGALHEEVVGLYLGRTLRRIPDAERALEVTTRALDRVRGSGSVVEAALLSDLASCRSELGDDRGGGGSRPASRGAGREARPRRGSAVRHAPRPGGAGAGCAGRPQGGLRRSSGRSLNIPESTLGAEHPVMALRLATVASALDGAGDHPRAVKARRSALRGRRERLRPGERDPRAPPDRGRQRARAPRGPRRRLRRLPPRPHGAREGAGHGPPPRRRLARHPRRPGRAPGRLHHRPRQRPPRPRPPGEGVRAGVGPGGIRPLVAGHGALHPGRVRRRRRPLPPRPGEARRRPGGRATPS